MTSAPSPTRWIIGFLCLLIGVFALVRTFSEARTLKARTERQQQTLSALEDLARQEAPALAARERLIRDAVEDPSDPVPWFEKERLETTWGAPQFTFVVPGAFVIRREVQLAPTDPDRLANALSRSQELRPPWRVVSLRLRADAEGRISGTLEMASVVQQETTP